MDQPKLCDLTCGPCKGGTPPMTRDEIAPLMPQVPKWQLIGGEDEHLAIERIWKFKDFAQAQAFVDAVGALAEREGHHPDIAYGWGYARITLWTHAANGLTRNDFIVAAKIDLLP